MFGAGSSRINDDLHVGEAGAVIEFEEREPFGVPPRADPAHYRDGFLRFRRRQNALDQCPHKRDAAVRAGHLAPALSVQGGSQSSADFQSAVSPSSNRQGQEPKRAPAWPLGLQSESGAIWRRAAEPQPKSQGQ